jgi:UDPglucose 6-dehydrogenase
MIGTGYVGLTSGVCFAELGNDVTCVDIDAEKIAKLKDGVLPIYEQGLSDYFHRNIDQGRLKFTTELPDAIGSRVLFLCTPTPPDPARENAADLRHVYGAAEEIGRLLTDYTVFVNKSTVPVGTGRQVHYRLAKGASEDLFDVVSNPEFLREGSAVSDFMHPDRIVVGADSEKAARIMRRLYEPLVRQGNPIFVTDTESAEIIKYASNAFLATKISFFNLIAQLEEATGADVESIRKAVGADKRIGTQFTYPGIGYGGSCFPKDTLALIETLKDNRIASGLFESVEAINETMKRRLPEKVINFFAGDVRGKKFALWGLAFKRDTDDVRETPSYPIIKALTDAGAEIVAHDPEAIGSFVGHYGPVEGLTFEHQQYDALRGADALLIAADWKSYEGADLDKMKELLASPLIFDGRNLYREEDYLMELQDLGYRYECIGRPIVDGRPAAT